MKKEECGMEISEKIEKVREELKLQGSTSCIFSALDDVACKLAKLIVWAFFGCIFACIHSNIVHWLIRVYCRVATVHF